MPHKYTLLFCSDLGFGVLLEVDTNETKTTQNWQWLHPGVSILQVSFSISGMFIFISGEQLKHLASQITFLKDNWDN